MSKKDFSVEIVMFRNVIFPQFINEFRVKIDNTKCSQAVTAVRLSLARTVNAGPFAHESIKVCNEEVGSDTNGGGAPNELI